VCVFVFVCGCVGGCVSWCVGEGVGWESMKQGLEVYF